MCTWIKRRLRVLLAGPLLPLHVNQGDAEGSYLTRRQYSSHLISLGYTSITETLCLTLVHFTDASVLPPLKKKGPDLKKPTQNKQEYRFFSLLHSFSRLLGYIPKKAELLGATQQLLLAFNVWSGATPYNFHMNIQQYTFIVCVVFVLLTIYATRAKFFCKTPISRILVKSCWFEFSYVYLRFSV